MPNIDNWKSKIKRKGLGQAPQEASENIKSPELAPRDNRFTGRTKQLGLRVKPEFLKKLKRTALEEDCFIVEVLERALESYEKQKQTQTTKKLSDYGKVIERKQKLNPYPYTNFTCDKCRKEYEQETAYSVAKNLKELDHYPTYCADCV